METEVKLFSFPDRESLTRELASYLAATLQRAVLEKGWASVAVSGGSTPVPVFEQLSTIPLPWEQVHVSLVDERWLEPNEKASNENLVRSHLLQNHAAAAHFTGMKNSAATPEGGEDGCETQLRKIMRPFDLLLLGMGSDGHTASLFPGAERIEAATEMDSGKICLGIVPVTAPHERMTLTLPAILASKEIVLHITGAEKKEVLEKAMGDGESLEMPIRFILRQQQTPLRIYWAP